MNEDNGSGLIRGWGPEHRGHFGHPSAERLRVGQFLFVDAGTVAFRRRRSTEGTSSADNDHLIAEHGRKDRQHRHFFAARNLSSGGKGSADLVLHFEFWKDTKFKLPVVEEGFHFA